MNAKFFIVNPHSAYGGLSIASSVASAAGVVFNPGSWLRPCSIAVPEKKEEADCVREMLVESCLQFHESPWDTAAY